MIDTLNGNIQTLEGIVRNLLSDAPQYEACEQQSQYLEPIQRSMVALLIRQRKEDKEIAERTFTSLACPDAPLACLAHVDIHAAPTPLVDTQPSSDESDMLPLPEEVIQCYRHLTPGISRWLDAYVDYGQRASPASPREFHIGCGLAVLSIVNARRSYVRLGKKQFYAPLNIALTAVSSLYAKTEAESVALGVLRAANLHWLLGDDSTTPQRLIHDMAGKDLPPNYGDMTRQEQEQTRRRLAMAGQRGWHKEEYGSLLQSIASPGGGHMQEFSGLLRVVDDCPPDYSYATRTHGQEVITKPYLPMLVTMTPADIRKLAAKDAEWWGNGFFARMIFLTPPLPKSPDDLYIIPFPLDDLEMPPELYTQLREWHERLGEPSLTVGERAEGDRTIYAIVDRGELSEQRCIFQPEAYTAYTLYLQAIRRMIAQRLCDGESMDLAGSYNRLPTAALRVAILLASLENEGHITLAYWAKGQEIAEMFRRNLHELYAQVNSATTLNISNEEDAVLAFLQAHPGQEFTSRDIRNGSRRLKKLGSEAITNHCRALSASGLVDITYQGRKTLYVFGSVDKCGRTKE